MNAMSLKILHSFEELPTPEQNELAAEILRMTLRDNNLSQAADSDWFIHAEEVALAQEIEFNSIE